MKRTAPRWLVILLAAAGMVAVGSVGALAYTASGELARQETALAQAQADLAAKRSELAGAQASLAEAKATHQELADRVAVLRTSWLAQTACIDARQADFAELDLTSIRLTDNWNRTAEKSAYAKAGDARVDALNDALKGYYQAALTRSLGQISASNTWLSKARAAERKAADKKKFMNDELAAVDAAAKEIAAALDALETRLAATRVRCEPSASNG